MSPLMLIAFLVVALIAFVIVIHNKMIKMRNQAEEAWSDIDVQLKRRYNLIPNLVETVKGYAAHEEGVFTKVTEARNMAINAGGMKEQAQAENMLSGALKSLFAVAENYPELKANENFMQLQNELVDTEDKIQAARRFYNGTVRDFNTKLQQFPNSMVASMFKFEVKEFFEVEDEAQKKNVEVSFSKEEKMEETPMSMPEAPVTEEATTPMEPAKCPMCGGEMAEGHVCPVTPVAEPVAEPVPEAKEEEKKEEMPEAVAETPMSMPEAPVTEEATTPMEPAKCPMCGGEMTEGHVCPVPEKMEEKPMEEMPKTEMPEAPTAPVEEAKPEEAMPMTEEAMPEADGEKKEDAA